MKIFTAEQLKTADQITMEKQDISSLELMERAADLAYLKIRKFLKKRKKSDVLVFCGLGNNGGDGLVISRKLLQDGFTVKTYILEYSKTQSSDFQENLRLLKEIDPESVLYLSDENDFPKIDSSDVIVDSIFGYGLNRALPEWVEKLIDTINNSSAYIFSIDLPSGMAADLKQVSKIFVQADESLTFQTGKIPFYLPETGEFAGKISVLDIGLDPDFLDSFESDFQFLEKDFLRNIYRKRKTFSHKGTYGHVLLAGGKYGMMGSMVLSSQAALRIGAGKVTSLIPKTGNDILQISVPEAMVLTNAGEQQLNRFIAPEFEPETICFGMGAGTDEKTADFFLDLMKFSKSPILIDADGINLLGKHPVLLEFIPKNSVLTPHLKELENLIGKWKNDAEKIEKSKKFVEKHKVVLVIKGAFTLIVTKEKIHINSTGNPGMATAGSGDVLSGAIAGLMAQNYSPEEAALLGVWLHGKAGDIALQNSSEEGLIAGDIILNFGRAFQKLKK